MPIPAHLIEGNYPKAFPPDLDAFPTVTNEEHYIDAWILNSVFNSLLSIEQFLLAYPGGGGGAPTGNDVLGVEGELEIAIPPACYPAYKFATAWDSNLLEENIKEGVTIFGVVGSCACPAGPHAIGEAFGGGYYAGQISTAGNGVADYYLIVAPKATGEGAEAWGPTSHTTGFTSVIDGPTNSAGLAALHDATHNYHAAAFCEALDIGGFTDWYLPAMNELEVLYFYLKPGTTANNTSSGSNANAVSPEPRSTVYTNTGVPATPLSPVQTVAIAFRTGGAEAFADYGYWSSTEIGINHSWSQQSSSGIQGDLTKTSGAYVRAVRRVAV